MLLYDAPLVATVTSDGTSVVKEPGHFQVRKSSSQVTQVHFFPPKSLQLFILQLFSCRPQNTAHQHRQNKTDKAVSQTW